MGIASLFCIVEERTLEETLATASASKPGFQDRQLVCDLAVSDLPGGFTDRHATRLLFEIDKHEGARFIDRF